jgi:hypothetical protein
VFDTLLQWGLGTIPVLVGRSRRRWSGAELLGVDLATVGELATKVEPYVPADGTRIWSLMELERQLRPEAYGRHRMATCIGGGHRPPTQSQFGASQAPLGMSRLSAVPLGAGPSETSSTTGALV